MKVGNKLALLIIAVHLPSVANVTTTLERSTYYIIPIYQYDSVLKHNSIE